MNLLSVRERVARNPASSLAIREGAALLQPTTPISGTGERHRRAPVSWGRRDFRSLFTWAGEWPSERIHERKNGTPSLPPV